MAFAPVAWSDETYIRTLSHCRRELAPRLRPSQPLVLRRRRLGGFGGVSAALGFAAHGSGCTSSGLVPTAICCAGSLFTGTAAALGVPVLVTIGLVLWDTHWRGSVFMLNLFKCTLAAIFFGTVAAMSSGSAASMLSAKVAAALSLSSFVGIIVGDNVWLLSVRILGARRSVLVDSLRPFFAAAAGAIFFGERASPVGFFAMVLAVAGTLIVALENQSDTGNGDTKGTREMFRGYLLAIATIVLDVSGSVLTRSFGRGLGPWMIGAMRFGFAATCMGAALAVSRAALFMKRFGWQSAAEKVKVLDLQAVEAVKSHAAWCEMPDQSRSAWIKVTAGACLITILTPALDYYAIFAIPLSLLMTLHSLGPVTSIPVLWVMKGESLSFRAALGSFLAVLGAALFCLSTPTA